MDVLKVIPGQVQIVPLIEWHCPKLDITEMFPWMAHRAV